MVDGQQQPVLLGGPVHHGRPHQRGLRQVERGAPLLPHHPPPFAFPGRLRQRTHIVFRQGQLERRRDDLHRVAVPVRKRRPQDLMPPHHFLQRPPQRGWRVPPLEADHIDDVVDRTAGDQLVEEPQLFLRERQRARSVLGPPFDPRRVATRALDVAQDGRQVPDSRVLEQGPGLQIHPEHVANPRHGPDRQQRIPTQLEEVVLATDVLNLQELGPNGGEGLLGLGERRCHLAGRLRALERDRRKRLAVHLPIGRQGEFVHQHECRGDHVLRQPCLQILAQRRGREDCSVGGQLRARVRVGGLVPDQSAPLGRRPDRVHVTQLGVSQQRVLLDQHFEPVALEQERDRLHVVALIHLDDGLADPGPVLRLESPQHIELALLHVDLEQVDALDALLRDDAREGSQPGRHRPGPKTVIDDLAHVRHEALVVRRRHLLIEHVALDHVALRRRIGVEPREERQALEPREVRRPAFAGQPERQAPHAGAPGGRVRLETREGGGVRLAGDDPEVRGQAAREHGEQPDVGAHVHDAVAFPDRDAVPQVRLLDEDLVVDVLGLVPVQMRHRRAVRQHVRRLPSPQRLVRPLGHDVRDQLLAARGIVVRPDHAVAHPALGPQRAFDLPELDPIAVQLDLVVDPTAELDAPVRQGPRQVARTIEALPRT